MDQHVDLIHALKIAFTFMPKAIDVTRYEYGDDYNRVLAQINTVRETLIAEGIDPEEVAGDINPDHTPNSTY